MIKAWYYRNQKRYSITNKGVRYYIRLARVAKHWGTEDALEVKQLEKKTKG